MHIGPRRIPPHPVPPVEIFDLQEDESAMLDCIGDVSDVHALILGEHGLELMCALIRRGCATVAVLRLNEKTDAVATDLVVIPRATCLQGVEQALRQARRAMVPGGRIILRIGADPACRLALSIKRLLRAAGFCAIGVRALRGKTLLTAERRAAGQVLCS